MDRIARYGKSTAEPGRGAELAQLLQRGADDLRDDPGCELDLLGGTGPA